MCQTQRVWYTHNNSSNNSVKAVFDGWINGLFKSPPSVRRFHEVFRTLSVLELDPTLTWRFEYYRSMINEYHLRPTIDTFNFLWRALVLSDSADFAIGIISVLLNEMDRFQVLPDSTTVYEILNLCAMCPLEGFPETAFRYMKYYLILMKERNIQRSKGSDRHIFHSYLRVWVNAKNGREAFECKKWISSMSLWDEHLQRTLDELGTEVMPLLDHGSRGEGLFTRDLWDLQLRLWHPRWDSHRRVNQKTFLIG